MPKENLKRTKVTTKRKLHVPYAKGYRPPPPEEALKAIGFKPDRLPLVYSDTIETPKYFSAIPAPSSIDDWLAQYAEEGQSFSQYLDENPWFSNRKLKFMRQSFNPKGKTISEKYPNGKIYIAKIGVFNSKDIMFSDLIDYVQRYLGLPVDVFEGLDIEKKGSDLILTEDPSHNPSKRQSARVKKSTLTTRFNSVSKHVQINVDSILPRMHLIMPDDALCLIGLTPYDLYGDESDLFVAGMASGNRCVAIFSLLRYDPALAFSKEFWYDIKTNKTIKQEERHRLILQRSCKLVVHELCHLLGLDHCIYFHCCMNGSGHLAEDFSQPMMLCPVDLHKLHALVGFDVLKRYESLLEFYEKHMFTEEAKWTSQRIKFISSKVAS